MTPLARLRSWIRSVVRRDDLERRMQLEMETHLELLESDLRGTGLSDAEARRLARAEFGSIDARKDECREALGLRLLGELRADAAYTLRLLRRSPGFAVVALMSLALGIGANTAIFSLIDVVMLKTLPVERPSRLVFVDTTGGKSGGSSGPPYPLFEVMRDSSQLFSGLAAFSEDRFKIAIDGNTEQVRGQYASGTYFELLGIRAQHGRLLTRADDTVFGRGGPDGAVCVISDTFWRERFGRDPAVLGRLLTVGERWVTIVGVTPPEFRGLQVGAPIDVTLPMMLAGDVVRSKGTWWMSVVGRIRDGVTIEQAQAELSALFNRYMTENEMARRGPITGVVLVPANRGLNDLRRRFSEPLLILMGIVALVLLIGCANVANLLLARASARRGELSVRLAIGASRGRLVRQLLTEGVVLASIGAIAGLAFAQLGATFLVAMVTTPGGILLEPRFDSRVLGFTATLALLTVMLFSVAPALHATQSGGPAGDRISPSRNRPRVRLGHALVIVQVMLAVALLCGAALFLQTLHRLNALDPGFRRDALFTMQIDATWPATETPSTVDARRHAFGAIGTQWTALAEHAASLHGVTAASVSTLSPLTGRDRGVRFAIRGATISDEQRSIHVNQVSADYFKALGISLVSGRFFTTQDRSGSPRVAVLNETAARTYFAGVTPSVT